MVYAHSVVRVTISGGSFSGAEEWSTGFFLGSANADASNPTQALADQIKARWQTFFTSAAVKVSNAFSTNEIKLSQIGADGKTILDNTVYSTYSSAIFGPLGTQLPAQVSLVATLQSPLARGLAAKGRMYLPGIASPVMTTGKIVSTDAAAVANALKTFFDGVNSDAGVAGKVILASAGRGTAGTGAVNQLVTRVRVGDVYDTQRRRRNQLPEVYSNATLA